MPKLRPTPFNAGDEVFHKPSGETWIVSRSGTDSVGGFVDLCGYPSYRARASDCVAIIDGKYADTGRHVYFD